MLTDFEFMVAIDLKMISLSKKSTSGCIISEIRHEPWVIALESRSAKF
jgi:hypothetical protein